MAKQINTRIQLKYDSYENWTKAPGKNLVLKIGEIGLCAVPAGNNEATTAPTVLFKVGDGTNEFSALKWGSALAADVYDWAKKDEASFITWMNEKVVHPTIPDGFTVSASATDDDIVIATLTGGKNSVTGNFTHAKKGPTTGFTGTQAAASINAAGESVTIKVPKLTVDAYGHTNAVEEIAYEITIPEAVVNTITELIEGTGISITDGGTSGNHNYTVALDVAETKTALGLKALAYKDSLAKADVGLGNVDNTADSAKPVSTAQAAAIANALAEAKEYADNNNTNTAHSHSAGSGTKVSAAGGISGDVKVNLNVAFELVDKTIKLYDKDDTTKAAIATLDATEFIKDGMLISVEANETDNELIFTWNTEAGITTTAIPFDKIADIYTGGANTEISVSVSNENAITATLVNKGVTEEKLEQDVQDALVLARTALQSHQDISGKKDKQVAVANAITDGAHVISSLAQDANGAITYAVKTLTPADIGAQAAGDYKTTQAAKNYTGATNKTVTGVTQDANGVVNVTYGDIAFPTGSGSVAVATNANGVVTLNGGIKLNNHSLEDDTTKADITLSKVATTGSTDDLDGGSEVWVFYCGNASTDLFNL